MAQIALPLEDRPWRTAGLFSDHYLTSRLPTAGADLWPPERDARTAFAAMVELWRKWSGPLAGASEEECEKRFIGPVLNLLGYGYLNRQRIPAAAQRQYPDFLLLDSETRADDVFKSGDDVYEASLALLEAKRWGTDLDVAKSKERSPHQQTRDYLTAAPLGLKWALLSDGRNWRLYHRDDRSSHYFDFNLAAVLGFALGDAMAEAAAFKQFQVFYALFRRAALVPGPGGRPIDLVRAGSLTYKAEVERDLREQVFACVELLGHGLLTRAQNGLAEADLPAIYENSLVLLYRLLFVLNAEARDLLPTKPQDAASDEFYHSFGLASVRQELAGAGGDRRYGSDYTIALMERMQSLFDLINGVQANTVGPDKNDELGIPRYNGGLFDPARYPLLNRCKVGDKTLAEVIRRLAFRQDKDGQQIAIDYLNLGERHLGSIYEGLLEHRLVLADGQAGVGGITTGLAVRLANDKGERKTSGAYYTPEKWVAYIVEHTLRPLLDRAAAALGPRAEDAEPDDSFAEAVLRLNVCDPAMGSGHFLVEALGVLAETIAMHPTTKPRLAYDRHGHPAGEATDASTLAYWKRRVAEACIYGVDLNPLAVELAKLSLWLQTVDRVPLSFLDHHLRVGNSLVGARLEDLPTLPRVGKGKVKSPEGPAIAGGKQAKQRRQTYPQALQLPLAFTANLARAVENAIASILRIEGLATETLSGIKEKERLWKQIAEETLAPFRAVADLWLAPWFGGDVTNAEYQAALDGVIQAGERTMPGIDRADRHYFHWELEFPDIFFNEHGQRSDTGGFDAVVGNPPWERVNLEENEFFALRDRAIATAPTGSKRKALIRELPTSNPSLWNEYQSAVHDIDAIRRFLQDSGQYPLCGLGRTNLYSVFSERASQLVRSTGRVGLLVPSGIATDSGTSAFFRMMVDGKRLAEVIDFENRAKVFEDVDSRFKFSILVMAGQGDPQLTVRAGFFMHQIEEIEDPERSFRLVPDDFALFNPNTRTCPIFRRRRDYEITRGIYERVPVLIDKGNGDAGNPWELRFRQGLFNMTTDSHLFHTEAELKAAGCWQDSRDPGNVWRGKEGRWLPLYEAKMIHQYDHRFATGVAGDEKLISGQASESVSVAQKADPTCSVMPRYWVPEAEVRYEGRVMLGFRDIARATDVRTCIATVMPKVGVGNTLPLILYEGAPALLTCLSANLSSFVLDYVARQKVSTTHLNFFIVEQFPILPPATYDADFHGVRLVNFISQRVLELSYTARDMKGLADDLGYDGQPFVWDEERRLHLRSQLDALYFILYGLDRAEAADVLDTFPIVKRQDEARWGKFRTKDLILSYMSAYSAGAMDAQVNG